MASDISEICFTTEQTKPIHVIYFSKDDSSSNGIWLAAAVVWRGPSCRRRHVVRDLFRRIRIRLGPLGAGFSIGREAGHWTGAAGRDGEQETLYHPARRVVRVLRREYALPEDGQTLVLLVDEAASAGRASDVTRHTLRAPSIAFPDPASSPRQAEESSVDPSSGEAAVWRQALQLDPVVRAFMAPRA
jgi:hypothetical protein